MMLGCIGRDEQGEVCMFEILGRRSVCHGVLSLERFAGFGLEACGIDISRALEETEATVWTFLSGTLQDVIAEI